MNRLENVFSNRTPALMVSVIDDIKPSWLEDIGQFVDAYEFRVDKLAHLTEEDREALLGKLGKLPILGTVRITSEGGDFDQETSNRLDIFDDLMAKVDGVDVELSAPDASDIISMARERQKLVIVSMHFFTEMPGFPTLEKTYELSKKLGADLVKIAAMALSPNDYKRLALYTKSVVARDFISIAMGEHMPEDPSKDLMANGSKAVYSSDGIHFATPWQLDYRSAFVRRAHC